MNAISANWLSIGVAVYLIAMMLHGHHKGFIRLAVSLVAIIATLVIVNASMPYVTKFLKDNTSIHQSIAQGMKKAVGIEDGGMGNQGGQGADGSQGTHGSQGTQESQPSVQQALIEGLNLPQQIKEALIANNNQEIYKLLGVDAFADYVSNYLADLVVRAVGFVILFIVTYILFRIVMGWLDIIARLPILHGMNKIAGALLGLAEGLIFLWIISMVVTACAGTPWGMKVIGQIEASPWLSFLYKNNFLNILVLGVMKKAF